MSWKNVASLAALMLFVPACVGGELTVSDPCEDGQVLTGGWSGQWATEQGECIPDVEPDAGETDGGGGDGTPDVDAGGPDDGDAGDGGGGSGGDGGGDTGADAGDLGDGGEGCEPGVPCCDGAPCCPPDDEDCYCGPTCCGPDCPRPCVGDECEPVCEEECCGPDCDPVCEGTQVEGHRIVGIVLQLTNPDVPRHKAKKLVRNSLSWVTHAHPCPGVKVLVVRDDNHQNEFKAEVEKIRDWLRDEGYDVTFMEEPSDGLRLADVAGYDAVWFSNPGHPIDDVQTIETLEDFVSRGGGLVMSGDDLSWGEVEAVSTEGLVHLEHERNGTRTCGLRTDNNDGESYKVSLNSSPHPVLAGLSGRDFLYANDIDHSSPLGLGEEILAWAELDPSLQCECDVRTPVIIVKDVAPFCEEIPEDPTSPCDEDCDHPEDPECTDDDGHPRRGHGYGHCKNADRPGHQSH